MSLGTGAKKDWWGPHASMRHSREVSMPVTANQRRHTELQWKYLPGFDFQQRWEEQGHKFTSETMQNRQL